MTPARACGTMRIVRATTSRTRAATAARTMRATMGEASCSVDERRGAVDLCNFDLLARAKRFAFQERSCRPFLAADLHAAAGSVDLLKDERLRADKRSRAGTAACRQPDVTARERTQHGDANDGRGDECDQCGDRAADEGGDECGAQCGRREGPEEEQPGRRDLADRQRRSCDRPESPVRDSEDQREPSLESRITGVILAGRTGPRTSALTPRAPSMSRYLPGRPSCRSDP